MADGVGDAVRCCRACLVQLRSTSAGFWCRRRRRLCFLFCSCIDARRVRTRGVVARHVLVAFATLSANVVQDVFVDRTEHRYRTQKMRSSRRALGESTHSPSSGTLPLHSVSGPLASPFASLVVPGGHAVHALFETYSFSAQSVANNNKAQLQRGSNLAQR